MTELRIIARCALMLAGVAASAQASAQAAPIAPSAAASAAAERAQKQTDRTMYWIRVLAEKQVAKPAPAPAAAPPRPAPPSQRPPAVATESRQPERLKVANASTAADNAAPAPLVVAAAAPAATQALAGGNAAAIAASSGAGPAASPTAAAAAAALAAPALNAAPPDIAAPEVEEPDPGLVMTRSADPEFPAATMRRLRKGEVEVRFEVSADGMVDSVTVVRSTYTGLNNAAIEAVRQWQFKPTSRPHAAAVTLAFNLDN